MSKTVYRSASVILLIVLTLGSYFNAGALSAEGAPALAAPKTYYVSPTGNDTNVGSNTSPFKTLAKGVSVLIAGDTLIASGRFNETLNASKSGTATARINFLGQGAVIDTNSNTGIAIKGSYVNVSGFEVTHVRQHAILNFGKHNIIENNVVHDSITENGVNGNCTLIPGGGWASGISIKLGSDDVIVRNNTVYHNCGEGIAVTRGSNTIVENNNVYDNFSLNIYVDNSFFVSVKNNTVNCTNYSLRDGHRAIGIGTGAETYSGWGMQLHDISILNNTVTGCYDNVRISSSGVSTPTVNILVGGNILPSGTRYAIANRAIVQNMVVSNNQIHSGGLSFNPSAGVTLSNNTIMVGAIAPTPTRTAAPVLPTATRTSIPMTATLIAPILPTANWTPIPMTATPLATLPVSSQIAPEIVYDDMNNAIVFSPGWLDLTDQQAYNGSYKANSSPNASANLDFMGQSFSILYTDGLSYRRMSVYVDGVLVETIYRKTDITTYQQRWDYPGQLTPGAHTLQLVFVNGQGSLDAVIVR